MLGRGGRNGEIGHLRRTFFQYSGFSPSYIGKSSKTSPILRQAYRAADRLWLKSASTSARCGAANAPPKRVHFSAAAAEANRKALRRSWPSVIASANAP